MRTFAISVSYFGPVLKIISAWVFNDDIRMHGNVNYSAEQLHASSDFPRSSNETRANIGLSRQRYVIAHLRRN